MKTAFPKRALFMAATLILHLLVPALNGQNLTSPANQSTTYWGPQNSSLSAVNASTSSTTQSPDAVAEPDRDPQQQPTVSKELFEKMNEVLDQFNLYFELFSIVLTLTSAYVYALPSMRCATAYYLVGLNSVDTLAGFLSVIRNAWKVVDLVAASSAAGYHYLAIGVIFVVVACRRMLYCFSLLLNAERFFVIAFPLKARYMKIIRYPKLCILAMMASILAYHVYLPLKYKVAPSSGGSGYAMTYSDAFKANKQVFGDVSNAAKIMLAYIPLVLCLALNVALMAALRRHAVSRESLQETQQDDPKAHSARSAERQLAMTIWLSTFLFTLLSLPLNISQVVSSYHDTFRFLGFEHRLYRLVQRFATIAMVSTRYTNFLAYLGLSTAFRRNLIRLLCPRKVVRKFEERRSRMASSQINSGDITTASVSQTQVFTLRSVGE